MKRWRFYDPRLMVWFDVEARTVTFEPGHVVFWGDGGKFYGDIVKAVRNEDVALLEPA